MFSSKIREIFRKGWKEAVREQKGDGDEPDGEEVPHFDESACALLDLRLLDRLTKPNREFAIDTLLAFMERPGSSGDENTKLAGLGTPATRAEIIRKLFSGQYLREDRKSLYATDRGLFLLGALSKNGSLKKMADVAQTTEWENSLASDPKAFEREIAEYVALCVKGGRERETFRQASLGACPLCKRPVYETKIGYGCSGYKENPKCGFIIFKTIAGASVSASDASLLLVGQKTKPKKCRSKEGKPFEASFALEGGNVRFLFKDKK